MIKFDLDLGGARVTSDEFNYIISLKKVKGKGASAGEEYWLPTYYHGTIPQVAKTLANLAADGVPITKSTIFDKIQALLDAETARLEKALRKGIK